MMMDNHPTTGSPHDNGNNKGYSLYPGAARHRARVLAVMPPTTDPTVLANATAAAAHALGMFDGPQTLLLTADPLLRQYVCGLVSALDASDHALSAQYTQSSALLDAARDRERLLTHKLDTFQARLAAAEHDVAAAQTTSAVTADLHFARVSELESALAARDEEIAGLRAQMGSVPSQPLSPPLPAQRGSTAVTSPRPLSPSPPPPPPSVDPTSVMAGASTIVTVQSNKITVTLQDTAAMSTYLRRPL
ncbi:hypothetical protein BC828DRAFT_202369 [Blastocladiella britannica]|nr:hypothetical protein BC828DRAFT_202369 [Blastocladiella britannica]